MKKRKQKTKRQRLKKNLDDLIVELVKIRDNYTCQKCGKKVRGRNCHASHIVPKTRYALRWNIVNLKVLCYHCHINWWHKNPLEAQQWFKEKFPERYKYLMKHKEDSGKFTLEELEGFKINLQKLLKQTCLERKTKN